MKESVTKFDLESAFKALDEIDIPVADKGIRANRPALTEIFSRKSKFDSLFEEYYDITSQDGLDDAKEAREAEVAKAKLDRIEKIVDLDADSPEDLLTSYVGKYIMQCPQCMTLFYKDKEDVVESEDDPTTVNVNEVCQHCGNESGYTLVGKVGEAEAENTEELPAELDTAEGEDLSLEEPADEAAEEPAEDDLEIDLDTINLEDEPVEEEEKTEEAFVAHLGEPLVEEIHDDKDLDAKLDAHNEYIEYLRTAISQEEAALEKATNEQVKVAIHRNIDAFKADLEAALPDAVKNDEAIAEEPAEETVIEEQPDEMPVEAEEVVESLTEALHEDNDLEVSAEEFEELINSPEFKKPISDSAARAMIDAEKDSEQEENSEPLEEGAFDKLKAKFTKRADKADWIKGHAMTDYEGLSLDEKGKIIIDTSKLRFNKYLVIEYKNTFSTGVKITQAPAHDNKNLIPASAPKLGDKYVSAENAAKGWSEMEGNGPAAIYLVKDKNDTKAMFLGLYFNGKLYEDQVEKNYLTLLKTITGATRRANGDMEQASDGEVETKEIKASELEIGTKLKTEKGIGEVTKIEQSIFGENTKKITIAFGNDEYSENFNIDSTVIAVVEPTVATESIDTSKLGMIMESIEELNEASLEKFISDSLVEAYGNVAGFRLTGCDYLNEKLNVNGTIYFTSGNTRKTTYAFSEAFAEEDKIKLCGLNEKLGIDKKFILTGKIDIVNKTLITESFVRSK